MKLIVDQHPFEASVAGIEAIKRLPLDRQAGHQAITIDLEDLSEAERVNFVALVHKSWKHIGFCLGHVNSQFAGRVKIWNRYRRNLIDVEHNEGCSFQSLMDKYLRDFLPLMAVDQSGCQYTFVGRFRNQPMRAMAALGLVNLARWAQKNTEQLKLLSEAYIKWSSFYQIWALGEQPLISRKARKPLVKKCEAA